MTSSTDFRFSTDGQPVADSGLLKRAPHDLRHTYASRALALGEGLLAIGRLLGHVRVGTTAKYAHLVRDAEKAAAARTGDSIGAWIMPGRCGATNKIETRTTIRMRREAAAWNGGRA